MSFFCSLRSQKEERVVPFSGKARKLNHFSSFMASEVNQKTTFKESLNSFVIQHLNW
jgi:hypothetical protein